MQIAEKKQKQRLYGWKRDNPDIRDYRMTQSFKIGKRHKLLPKMDLRNECMPVIFDQGFLGSCTANASCSAFSYHRYSNTKFLDDLKKDKESFDDSDDSDDLEDSEKSNDQEKKQEEYSRLFLYYNTRKIENNEKEDSGALIRDTMKSLNKGGVCKEQLHPYNVKNFNISPSVKAYKDALYNKCIRYLSIKCLVNDFKESISSNHPVIFGFSVPDYFEGTEIEKTGIMKPYKNEELLGGHAVLACGYDDNMEHYGEKGYMLIRNSWGIEWGDKGYFYMPYSFINFGMCSDAWIIKYIS